MILKTIINNFHNLYQNLNLIIILMILITHPKAMNLIKLKYIIILILHMEKTNKMKKGDFII